MRIFRAQACYSFYERAICTFESGIDTSGSRHESNERMSVRLVTCFSRLSHVFAAVAFCWIADRPRYEVLINGFKRGVSPKHRFRDKSRSVFFLFLVVI